MHRFGRHESLVLLSWLASICNREILISGTRRTKTAGEALMEVSQGNKPEHMEHALREVTMPGRLDTPLSQFHGGAQTQ
jgi:hypothetical protein